MINDKDVCRTAPTIQGLLITLCKQDTSDFLERDCCVVTQLSINKKSKHQKKNSSSIYPLSWTNTVSVLLPDCTSTSSRQQGLGNVITLYHHAGLKLG